MATDVEGVDEIVEQAHSVQLVFHVRRDWLAEADEAAQEVAWKSDRCAQFLRSPDFRQRFGMKPGTILMKSARHPPGDVLAQLARLGAEVEVGTIPLAGQSASLVSCAVCGRSGFVNAQMSMTERGLTCPTCFNAWSNQQALAYPQSGSLTPARSPGWIAARVIIGVTLVVLLNVLRHCH
jgi:hypothetical protein